VERRWSRDANFAPVLAALRAAGDPRAKASASCTGGVTPSWLTSDCAAADAA
jgi:hypothetical protein